jgi:hypothetical protein
MGREVHVCEKEEKRDKFYLENIGGDITGDTDTGGRML